MSNPAYLSTATGERFTLRTGAVIGRSSDADVVFAIDKVSRRHARVAIRTGTWWLHDLASKNGTFVNGHAVGTAPQRLCHGDEIVFGGAVTVQFNDPAATPIAPRIGRLHGVWIDPESHAVWVDAARIDPPLSALQLSLLRLLYENADQIVTRPSIVAHVWNDDAADGVSDDAVSALVKRVRSRLREGSQSGDYVQVIKGRGVRLRSD